MIIGDTFMTVTETAVASLKLDPNNVFLAQVRACSHVCLCVRDGCVRTSLVAEHAMLTSSTAAHTLLRIWSLRVSALESAHGHCKKCQWMRWRFYTLTVTH